MSLEAILTSLLVGAIAGTAAGFLMGSKGGLIRNIVIGIMNLFIIRTKFGFRIWK